MGKMRGIREDDAPNHCSETVMTVYQFPSPGQNPTPRTAAGTAPQASLGVVGSLTQLPGVSERYARKLAAGSQQLHGAIRIARQGKGALLQVGGFSRHLDERELVWLRDRLEGIEADLEAERYFAVD